MPETHEYEAERIVGAVVHSRHVSTARQTMDSLNAWRGARAPVRTTSFSSLDDVTGGFEPGQFWIVVGTPGQGRSTLAAQWALLLAAEHGFTTQLVCKRDPARKTAARLVASAGNVPEQHLWRREGPPQQDEPRISRAMEALGRAPLEICDPTGLSIVDSDASELSRPESLVVDDADLAGGIHPRRVREFVEGGMLVVLTLPRAHVVKNGEIDLEWARAADFIIDLERPARFSPSTTRPGETQFHVLYNRWGPCWTHSAVFLGHYARFADVVL